MYKAQKDTKIIAINDTGDFPCLVYDEVVEDTEHTIEDYTHYNGEFILNSDVPAPTEEEQRQKRAEAYANEIDPLHSQKQRRIILGTWTEEDEQEYTQKVKELSDSIAQRFPYPVDNDPEYDSLM